MKIGEFPEAMTLPDQRRASTAGVKGVFFGMVGLPLVLVNRDG